jgi:hypothetical protein
MTVVLFLSMTPLALAFKNARVTHRRLPPLNCRTSSNANRNDDAWTEHAIMVIVFDDSNIKAPISRSFEQRNWRNGSGTFVESTRAL